MPDEKKLTPPEAGPEAPAELNELLREAYFACLAAKGKTDEAAQKECADVAWEKAKEKYEEADGEWTLKAEARFRKEIIRVGRYVLPDDPAKTVDVTLERLRDWVNDTRAAGVKTWVPYHHSYHPADNAGWVEAFEISDGKLYGVFNITDEGTAAKIVDGTIQDVSVGVGPVLTACGRRYDEVIRHVALTLDPHVREQDGFRALMEARRDGGFYFRAGDAVAEENEPEAEGPEEEWDEEYINALPDESFAYIEPGGEKDEEGKTVPRELRHFPVRDADGNVSLPHVEEALAALDTEKMSTGEPIPEEDRERVRAELEKLLEEAGAEGESAPEEEKAAVEAESARSRRLARFLGKLGFRGEGAASKEVARMEARLDGLSARFEALRGRHERLAAEFEAVKAERDNLRLEKLERAAEDRVAFEAEANRFAAALVRAGRAKPANRRKWLELYLKDKELAMEAAAALEVRFDASSTDGQPQEYGRPAEPSPLARENPEVVEVLKAMGYDEAAIERRLGELYGES
ncbi:MAG: hypothetical protein GTN49_04975 [candidate division Zixibacteria bacterium]|nr:hypothetical protein [candidate division Zixibacteria bacterium]